MRPARTGGPYARTLAGRLVRAALALGLLLTAAACGGGSGGHQRVTIMVPWSGAEFRAFYQVVKKFERDTGIGVDVQVTRATTQQLDAAVAAHAPPDLAVLSSVGAIDGYAASGELHPLGLSLDGFVEPFRGLATVGGTVYAVPVKADVKSLIWYDPAAGGSAPPQRPADLRELSRRDPHAWCLGLASGPTSGWPGADWIADILLGRGDTDGYEQWLSGELPWSSAKVTAAWTAWRQQVADSASGAAATEFADAAAGMRPPHPTCSFAHGGLAAMGFTAEQTPGRDYDYVPFSPDGRLEVSADFVGMFTTGNPSATALLRYLATDDAQRLWVNQPLGYALSADSRVTPAAYRDNPVQRRIAAILQPHSGSTLCFSAADVLPPDVSAAFYRAVLRYTTGAEPLPDLLTGLDAVQKAQSRSLVHPAGLCAAPH